jgi:collagenase-like PrtC family protease
MSSRIDSILQLFNAEERFCHSKERQTMSYIESLSPKDYTVYNEEFHLMREKSLQFLKDSLGGEVL